jgi:hypothetical protein
MISQTYSQKPRRNIAPSRVTVKVSAIRDIGSMLSDRSRFARRMKVKCDLPDCTSYGRVEDGRRWTTS